MHVVVVGCGRVGSGLARAVEAAGHTAAVVDQKERAFQRFLAEGFNGKTILGIGFDRDILIEAGIEQAGAVAAVTSGDNSNILVARVARETYGIERVVARIKDPRRAAIYERVGIATIAPAQWATDRVLRRILHDTDDVDWIDPSAKVVLVERPVPPTLAGRKVGDLDAATGVRIVALLRLGVGQVPGAGVVLQEGDVVFLALAADDLDGLEARMGAM